MLGAYLFEVYTILLRVHMHIANTAGKTSRYAACAKKALSAVSKCRSKMDDQAFEDCPELRASLYYGLGRGAPATGARKTRFVLRPFATETAFERPWIGEASPMTTGGRP